MSHDLVVYGVKGSPFVRKVTMALAEKGVDYDHEQVSIFPAPDWFVEISPLKRIPVLRDRSVAEEGVAGTIADSSAIIGYLERKFPTPALIPADPYEAGRALWFEEYADSVMAATIGMGMFRPVVLNRMMGKEPDLATARDTLETKLPPYFDYLESQLDGKANFVGDGFTLADLSVATQFINFHFAGGRIDAGRWPSLAAFFTAQLDRPSIKAAFEEESAFFPPTDLSA